MHPAELSPSTQDYLKTIWRLGEWEPERVTTTSLAARMGLAASTVSEALKKLTAQGLVTRPAYGVVELTEQGRDVAVHMVRRHRILEMFLATELGYAWDEIHDEAEVLEHAVTDRFIDRVDAKLGHPSEDPHGDAIPSRDGVVTPAPAVPLADVTHPEPVRVTRVSDESPETLRVLAEAGIRPGAVLRVLPGPARSATVRVRVAAGGTTPEAHLPGAVRATRGMRICRGTAAPPRRTLAFRGAARPPLGTRGDRPAPRERTQPVARLWTSASSWRRPSGCRRSPTRADRNGRSPGRPRTASASRWTGRRLPGQWVPLPCPAPSRALKVNSR